LASASQARKKILEDAGYDLVHISSRIDESKKNDETPKAYAMRLAEEKSKKITQDFAVDFILTADTVVVCEEEVLGKPASADDAFLMMRKLSGRMHEVITALSLRRADDKTFQTLITRSEISEVEFRTLSEKEISEYVQSGLWKEKAGGYGIQDDHNFVKTLHGNKSNVVGVSLPLLEEMLAEFEAKK